MIEPAGASGGSNSKPARTRLFRFSKMYTARRQCLPIIWHTSLRGRNVHSRGPAALSSDLPLASSCRFRAHVVVILFLNTYYACKISLCIRYVPSARSIVAARERTEANRTGNVALLIYNLVGTLYRHVPTLDYDVRAALLKFEKTNDEFLFPRRA